MLEEDYVDQDQDLEPEIIETEDDVVERLSKTLLDEPVGTEPTVSEPAKVEEAPAVELFKVKIDGVEKEVTKEELVNGYQRQSDYTAKTQQLSQERQQVIEQQQKYSQYLQSIPMLATTAQQNVQQLEAQLYSQELADLVTTEPGEYVKIKAQIEREIMQNKQAYNDMAAQWTNHQNESQAMQQQAMQEVLVKSNEYLADKIEGWKDGAVQPKLRDAAIKYGFTPQEAENIWDHRQVEVLNKARLYDELMAKSNLTSKRVAEVPPRTMKPGNGEVVDEGKSFKKQAMKKAAAGDDSDLLAYLAGGV
jgi:hypothetical protein